MSRQLNGKVRFSTSHFWLILSILALLVAAVGLGCGKGDETTGTTVSTAKQMEPAPVSPSGGGGAMTVVVPTTPTSTMEDDTMTGDDTVTGADDGMPTVVYTHDEVGPCEGGMQEVTHYTEYSDGTSASSISMQPCGDDFSPVEE